MAPNLKNRLMFEFLEFLVFVEVDQGKFELHRRDKKQKKILLF